jgi:CheY-like chemotaxis protein
MAGLAISKHLVELMDGEIGYINNVGEGTSFWFNVKIKKGVPNSPLDEVEEYKANATDKVSDNQKSKYKILIAEDNLINQLVALEILKNLGYQADKASNGEDVLSAMKKVPYDLILMDCQMPIMDGYQATSSIRSKQLLDINSSIPIIAMTAAAMKGDREKCIESGMNDYLTKPIDPLALSEMLNKWL